MTIYTLLIVRQPVWCGVKLERLLDRIPLEFLDSFDYCKIQVLLVLRFACLRVKGRKDHTLILCSYLILAAYSFCKGFL